MKILLIEDNREIALTIKRQLEKTFIVDWTNEGLEGKYLAEIIDYDLIILDLKLPDEDGMNVCSYLRKKEVYTPILILTGQAEISQKILALDMGADDYLTKPFNFSELLARVRALSRRKMAKTQNHILKVQDLMLNRSTRTVTRANKIIPLRRKEFDLLEYMIRNLGKVITREMFINYVWDNKYDSFTNTVDVHMKYLKDLIDKPYPKKLIKTVYGLGYKITE